jgi:hypothetical protein
MQKRLRRALTNFSSLQLTLILLVVTVLVQFHKYKPIIIMFLLHILILGAISESKVSGTWLAVIAVNMGSWAIAVTIYGVYFVLRSIHESSRERVRKL